MHNLRSGAVSLVARSAALAIGLVAVGFVGFANANEEGTLNDGAGGAGGYYTQCQTPERCAQRAVIKMGRPLNQYVSLIGKARHAMDMVDSLRGKNGDVSYYGNLEPGNYGYVDTLINMVAPISPNRPLTQADSDIGLLTKVGAGSGLDRKKFSDWQEIPVPKSTGASCMGGEEYKFYAKLTPASNNIMMFFEAGGACTDYEGCTGRFANMSFDPATGVKTPILDANGKQEYKNMGLLVRNPNGIPNKYLQVVGSQKGRKRFETVAMNSPMLQGEVLKSLSSTLDGALLSLQALESRRFKMEEWNIVFLPYCTADAHVGNAVQTYVHGEAPPRIVHHKGFKNVQAVLSILRNKLPQPAQLLAYGQSAGGVGVDFLRPLIREALKPTHSFYALIDGVAAGKEYGAEIPMTTPAEKIAAGQIHLNYPQTGLLAGVKTKWWKHRKPYSNDDAHIPDSSPFRVIKKLVPTLTASNLSSYSKLVNQRFPQDRVLYSMSQSDGVIPAYIYRHMPGRMAAAAASGEAVQFRAVSHFNPLQRFNRQIWGTELRALKAKIDTQNGNVGYFMPSGRFTANSHVLTGLNYEGSINYDTGTRITHAIESLMSHNPSVPVTREFESNKISGLRPLNSSSEFSKSLYVHSQNLLGVDVGGMTTQMTLDGAYPAGNWPAEEYNDYGPSACTNCPTLNLPASVD